LVARPYDGIALTEPPSAPSPSPLPAGDAEFQQLYRQLRGLARRMLDGERTGHTLQATALVHEAWLGLQRTGSVTASDAPRFQRMAAAAMRNILVEHARSRGRQKRGGKAARIPLDALELVSRGEDGELLALDEALRELEQREPELGELVQLRFFAGLSIEEIAQTLGISVRTVHRDWNLAKAMLSRTLKAEPE
jgi:RNA polymerase sigma factor (TIGR02999 family)